MNLNTLEPRRLWTIFAAICSLPHTSHHEAALAAWIRDRALARGLESTTDAAGNLILRKPAAAGHEAAPGLILQAHLDMVGQANADAMHDFTRDPIRPRPCSTEPDWLEASGTTLGADNGIGIAAALAFIESEDLVHGPLECLFTVNEEDGMDGARSLAAGALRGSYLLNLDNEDEHELCIGCAGTVRIRARQALAATAPGEGLVWLEVVVEGLQGGHSGADIHLGRANASRSLAELLLRSGEGIPWRLAALEGGNAANAIPREARARVAIPASARADWGSAFDVALADLRGRFADTEPDFRASASATEVPGGALSPEQSCSILASLLALPNGLLALSSELPGMVQSSCNLGIVRLSGELGLEFDALAMVRSSNEAEKESIALEVERGFLSLGSEPKRQSTAPAWTPEPESPLLALASETYRDLFDREAGVMATHGGLECGLFRRTFPHWDMVSIGPTIRFPHSPKEAVYMPSVERFWRFLTRLAARLASAAP